MRKFFANLFVFTIVALFSIPLAANGASSDQLPNFVWEQYLRYMSYYGELSAYARPCAWGTGTYVAGGKEIPFTFFGYTNTDAYMQFNISSNIRAMDSAKVMSTLDRIARPWECRNAPWGCYIGTTNLDLLDGGQGEYPYVRAVDASVEALNHLACFKDIVVVEYFIHVTPWPSWYKRATGTYKFKDQLRSFELAFSSLGPYMDLEVSFLPTANNDVLDSATCYSIADGIRSTLNKDFQAYYYHFRFNGYRTIAGDSTSFNQAVTSALGQIREHAPISNVLLE